MNHTKRINLRNEWERFRTLKPTLTQTALSKNLGYSSSVFGKMLNGTTELTMETVVKIANYFEVPPTRIDNEWVHTQYGEFNVQRTSSGYPAPAKTKLHKTIAVGRYVVWNDCNLAIERGDDFEDFPKSAVQSGFIPNTTIICVPADTVSFSDPAFPPSSPPIYLIVPEEGKLRAIATAIKPSVKNTTVYRVTGILLL